MAVIKTERSFRKEGAIKQTVNLATDLAKSGAEAMHESAELLVDTLVVARKGMKLLDESLNDTIIEIRLETMETMQEHKARYIANGMSEEEAQKILDDVTKDLSRSRRYSYSYEN